MAEKESLTEESKWLIELFRLLWVTLLAIGGGTAGLILGEHNLLRNTFRTWQNITCRFGYRVPLLACPAVPYSRKVIS